MRSPDGTVVGETLAMAETLAENHPNAGLWPAAANARATARWLCAEMTSGFGALRDACPMQLQYAYQGFKPSTAVATDLARVETLWSHARAISNTQSNWLFGDYCLTEAFFTPIAARIVGYDLSVSQQSRAYCDALLSDPSVLKWRAEALKTTYDPFPYALDLPKTTWPVDR